jgi:hypothetical protein
MSHQENEVRQALQSLLDSIEPPPALPRGAVHRAKARRYLYAAIAGSLGVILLAVTAWGVMAIGRGADGDSPLPAVDSPAPDEHAPSLYLAGDGELWSTDLEGHVRHEKVSELSPGDAPYRIVRRGNRLVAWGYETYLLDPELEKEPQVLVKDSLIFIPSSHEDRVWVGIQERGNESGGLEAVREVTTDGEVTVPDLRPPGGDWPERSLDNGLVFSAQGEKIVWDPKTGEVVFRFDADNLGPTHGNLIATCSGSCETMSIIDVATGSQATVEPPPGFAALDVWAGEFSPDGTSIAVPVRREVRDPESPSSEVQLALVDVATETARTIEGSNVGDVYNFVAWSPSGEHVFHTGLEESDERRIIVFRLGDNSARVLPASVGEFYGVAVLDR